jgi:hypothetical protein
LLLAILLLATTLANPTINTEQQTQTTATILSQKQQLASTGRYHLALPYVKNDSLTKLTTTVREIKTVTEKLEQEQQAAQVTSGTNNTTFASYSSWVNICQTDGTSQYWADWVNKELEVVPVKLLESFTANGWKMYTTTKNIDKVWFNGAYGSVKGVTDWDTKEIYLEDRNNAVLEATIHEFGHYVDWLNNKISTTSEFQELYAQEGQMFKQAYSVTFYYNNNEFFAEAFSEYCKNPAKLQANCPNIYTMMQDICS